MKTKDIKMIGMIESSHLIDYIVNNFNHKSLEIEYYDDSNIEVSGPSWKAKKYLNQLKTQYRKKLLYLYKTKNIETGWSIAGVKNN